jgi:quercetin dioxygenase-like cupin family protein
MKLSHYLSSIFLLLFSLCSPKSYTQELDPYEAGWEGEKVCEILHEDESNRVLLCTFPPGTGHERHMHGPTYNYILEGARLVITDENGELELTLRSGLNYFSEAVAWHEVLNIGSTTLKALLVESK